MKSTFIALFAASFLAVSAHAETAAPVASAPAAQQAAKPDAAHPGKDYVILRINGKDVKHSEAEEMWKSLFPGANAPAFDTFDENTRLNVLRGIASEHLVYDQAVKEGFDRSEEVEKRLESLKRQLILQAFMEAKAKELVTDAALRDAYAKKVAAMKNEEEVHARHILVATEAEAKAVEQEVKKNNDFEKVAKEKSLDKASGAQGGDLGWFTKDKMVPAFAEAAFKLKKGEISDPVKTQFGWHIIQVVDRRKVPIPSFEEMKDDLRNELTAPALQGYVDTLLEKADIKYYGPDGKEKPFPRTAPPQKK